MSACCRPNMPAVRSRTRRVIRERTRPDLAKSGEGRAAIQHSEPQRENLFWLAHTAEEMGAAAISSALCMLRSVPLGKYWRTPRRPERPPGAQARRQLAPQRASSSNEQRLIDGFMADAHGVIVREVDREPAGDLLRAPGVCPPPILPPSMSTAFPGHGWAGHKSIGSQCRVDRKLPLLWRRAARSACHRAVVARYSRPRFEWRHCAATPVRSSTLFPPEPASDFPHWVAPRAKKRDFLPLREQEIPARERLGPNIAGSIPPAFRSHLVPTTGGTPASSAASSLSKPTAIAAQNRRRSSRPATEGQPGDDNGARPDRSERRFRIFIATSFIRVLRRPLESAQYVSIKYTERLAEAGIEQSIGSVGDSYDSALAETINGLYGAEAPAVAIIRGGRVRQP